MRLLGLKLDRYSEWLSVLAEEQKARGFTGKLLLLWDMLRELHGLRRGWRQRRYGRLRKCCRCPVFDRSRHRCGPAEFPALGCRCYMPLAAAFKEHGWLTVAVGDPEKFCW